MSELLNYERACYQHIAGVDEVGRGCLFGDVIAAAVIMPQGAIIEGVTDSKKLTDKKRERLYTEIMEQALAVGVGYVPADVIDEINIRQAALRAMKQALEQLSVVPDYILVDAETVDMPQPQQSIIKGDANSHSIAAASIIAKVTRDRLCEGEWEQLYPGYGIAGHKGYATKLHRERILELGVTPMHRRSFLGNLLLEQPTLF
jgi:ribonuclease HII